MNYWILLTAPLVWLIAFGSVSTKDRYNYEMPVFEKVFWSTVITIATYLALYGISQGMK